MIIIINCIRYTNERNQLTFDNRREMFDNLSSIRTKPKTTFPYGMLFFITAKL